MASIISHAIVGLAAASVVSHGEMPLRFWVLSALCPVLPDADVVTFHFGIPYSHFLGHRGFFHSFVFALLLGGVVATFFFSREAPLFTQRWLLLCGYFSLLTATHGILDAMTDGGMGIALFSPFDTTRYFLPWTPIKVSPIGIKSFFSPWGARVILSEAVWIWIPAALMVIAARLLFHK
ncbi:MAG: metal-dependent hydrolase [Alphaproteobacteria bacterium]|uniref:Metal-dependent hydrolase n=1 Tax=Candidatus Nitrobium versatile TaxID=2884831 RepID=A0A953M3A5_9BACT|nr:metal-dependent hydrolase [Candidatus Nitrobium versatile]